MAPLSRLALFLIPQNKKRLRKMMYGRRASILLQMVMGMLKMQDAEKTMFQTINFNFYTTSAVLQVKQQRISSLLVIERYSMRAFDFVLHRRYSSFSLEGEGNLIYTVILHQ